VLISGGGGGTNIYNSNGTLTGTRTLTNGGFDLIFSGGANAFNLDFDANINLARTLSFTTASVDRWKFQVTDNETGTNAGSNLYLKSYNDAGTFTRDSIYIERATGEISVYAEDTLSTNGANLSGIYNVARGTYTTSSYTGGNPQGALFNIFTFDPRTNLTFANSQFVSTYSNVCRLEPTDTQTVTMSQGTGGIRTMGPGQSQIQYNIPATKTLTVSHLSNYTSLGIYELIAGGNLTATNAYHIVLNDLNEYTFGTLTLTNRWGIYQAGANDINYFNANTLFGTTTNAGYKVDVSGTARVTQDAYFATTSGSVGINTLTPLAPLHVGNGTTTGSTDPLILASRVINSGSGNSRGFSDATNYARSGGTAYASYDARISMTGTNNFAHYAAFQSGPTLNFTGTITDVFNYISAPTYTAGTITNSFGTYIQNPVKTGATLTNNYGHYFPATFNAGTNNWVFYNASTERSYSAGDTISRRFFAGSNSVATPAAQFHADGTGDIRLRLQQSGFNYWDFTSVSGQTYATIGDVGGAYVTFFNLGSVAIGTTSIGSSATRTLAISTGTAPASSPADCFQLYSADITAGNAAAHFRTEGGAIIKVYQETTAVGSATFASPGAGSTVKTDDTFDGYTIQQVVKALRNQGLLA
jgi:hypothetical protein